MAQNGTGSMQPYGFRLSGGQRKKEQRGAVRPGGQPAGVPAVPAPAVDVPDGTVRKPDGAGELNRAVRLAVGDGCEADWPEAMECLARAEAAGVTDARAAFKTRCAAYEAAELARLKRNASQQARLAARQMEEGLSRCSEPPAFSPGRSVPGAQAPIPAAAGIAGMVLSAVGLVLALGLALAGLGALFPDSPLAGLSRILTGWLPLGGVLARLSPGMIFVGAEFAFQTSSGGGLRSALRQLPAAAVALFLIWAVTGLLGRGRLIFGLLRAVFWGAVNIGAYAAVLIYVRQRAVTGL